jgi:hypothetical protein
VVVRSRWLLVAGRGFPCHGWRTPHREVDASDTGRGRRLNLTVSVTRPVPASERAGEPGDVRNDTDGPPERGGAAHPPRESRIRREVR